MTNQQIADELKNHIKPQEYNNLILQMTYKEDISNEKEAFFSVSNDFIANFIKTKYKNVIENIFLKIEGTKPEITISSKMAKNVVVKTQVTQIENESVNNFLNPSYVFDSFIKGKSNEMAYSVAEAICDEKNFGKLYNPFFIYGSTGLGKTHLLQAIGNQSITNGKNVIFVTSEQFTNDFTFSLKNDNMNSFREKYRKCDLLLIDDIQFLSGKERTQEEFFHTFNELHTQKKQIILTSDRSPNQIDDVKDRLISRFKWGLTADIQLPELETKIAIVEKKCEINKINLTKDIINFIATQLNSSIRDVEEVLSKIHASTNILHQKISLDLVKSFIEEHIEKNKNKIDLLDIINIVSTQLNIKPSDLKSSKRTKNIVDARRLVIYLSRELTHNSMPKIAKFLGMKDHSSISKNITKTNQLIKTDEKFKLTIDNLKNKIINNK